MKKYINSNHSKAVIGKKNPRWKGGFYFKDGYKFIYCPEHQNCNAIGYVREHRLIMEKFIGRTLLKTEVVHHIDKNKSNNKIDNLRLMNKSEHAKLETNGINNPFYGKHHTLETRLKMSKLKFAYWRAIN